MQQPVAGHEQNGRRRFRRRRGEPITEALIYLIGEAACDKLIAGRIAEIHEVGFVDEDGEWHPPRGPKE